MAWYRFRVTFGRRVSGLLAIVLLIGLTGGIALGSIAGARRTQSSYPKFLASTDPSDLTVSSFAAQGATVTSLKHAIARVPGVKRVATADLPPFTLVTARGAPNPFPTVFMVGSTDGELFGQDRVTVVHGRMANPTKANEVVLTPSAAHQLNAHVGEVLRLGLFASHTAPARLRVTATVVGIVEFDNQVIQDDIDAAFGFVVITPALLREAIAAVPAAGAPTLYGLQLDGGSRAVAGVEHALIKLIPNGAQYEFHVTAPVVAQVEDAIRPESIALGAFGAIAALVALVIAAQAASRQLRLDDDDRQVLRALGATPTMTIADGLVGVLGAILLGSIVAVVVAVGVSPFAPLGPVRAVYPTSGLAFDWTVLGLGFAGLVVVSSCIALAIAYRRAPHRVAVQRAQTRSRRSRAARSAENAGLPVPCVTGVRFALEPGVGRAAVPVRSALTGTVIAVAMVITTLTFASGLRTLVSHPSLYGWNWTYAISPSNEVPPFTQNLLTHDRDVAGWGGASELIVEIDGQTVPALLTDPHAAVAPPILSGHGLEATDQIVLGSATLSRLHSHVGDSVVLSYGSPADAPAYIAPVHVRVVGTATLPAVGFASFVADHTSMGTGALVPTDIESAAFRKIQLNSDPLLNGYDFVFVRMRAGVSAAKGRSGLQHIVAATDRAFNADPNAAGNNITVVGVQRPAQIVNYRSLGDAPVLLAAGLAVGAVFALSLTLVASVRRRRRELALLKTLGCTRRQIAAVIAWQSTIVVAIGVVVGVPVGIVAGRASWDLFARTINAVPRATVPTPAIVLVVVGSLVLANIVAAIPGLQAARTRPALLLHAESVQ